MRLFRYVGLGIGLFVAFMAVMAVVMANGSATAQEASTAKAFANARPKSDTSTDTVSKVLGTRPDVYGSEWQGRELQTMIASNPGSQRFVLSASDTKGERVEVTADLAANTLERKHWHADGHGTTDFWIGSVAERLQNASDGDGFNYGSTVLRLPKSSSF